MLERVWRTCTVGGKVNWHNHYWEQYGGSLKTKNTTIIWPRVPLLGTQETSHAQMLVALQGSPMANPKSLKDKTQGKCLICKQVGHWSKENPYCDKSPKVACYKCHQLGLGGTLPSGPESLKVKHQPSLMIVQHEWSGLLQPAHLSNPFCLCSGQQATTRSASSTRIYKSTPNHRKYHSPLNEHHYKDLVAWN